MRYKILTILLLLTTPLSLMGAQFDYQNYNHGYVPSCDYCGCNPCKCGRSPNLPPPPQPIAPPGAAPAPAPVGDCCAEPPTPCCEPIAPVSGTKCGISVCALGIGLAAVAAAAAVIISSGNGRASH